MQVEFDYIINLAKLYKMLNNNEDFLYDSLNGISQDDLDAIYKVYGDAEKKYQPVNLLRVEIATQLNRKKNR